MAAPPLRRFDATDAIRIGGKRRPMGDLYHQLLTRTWPELFALLLVGYVGANVVFALGYLVGGASIENAKPGSFADAFFFSVQTMATIGYGKMAPANLYANILVAIEALVGLVSLAVVTGLVFAKFSRPTARVLFSQVAVVALREGIPTLMCRMANKRGNQIVEAQLRWTLVRTEVTSEGERMRRFYDLPLVRERNAVFALSWTAMHLVTPESPFFGATRESLEEIDAQLIVSLIGLDETMSQMVHARVNYHAAQIVFGARFVDILSRAKDGRAMIDFTHFHDFQPHPSTSSSD
jgi:inward rectifier potassium channel